MTLQNQGLAGQQQQEAKGIQQIIQLLLQGVPPEELISRGIPEEVVKQAMSIAQQQQQQQQQQQSAPEQGLAGQQQQQQMQAQQEVAGLLQQGIQPQELLQKGVPKEIIQQAMQTQAGPPRA